ncbi:MAG: hypothetical protein GF384_01015 [Elusimicrobia bacterium]|nr:hypothetical protein [Elusimicrobiota bacterium]
MRLLKIFIMFLFFMPPKGVFGQDKPDATEYHDGSPITVDETEPVDILIDNQREMIRQNLRLDGIENDDIGIAQDRFDRMIEEGVPPQHARQTIIQSVEDASSRGVTGRALTEELDSVTDQTINDLNQNIRDIEPQDIQYDDAITPRPFRDRTNTQNEDSDGESSAPSGISNEPVDGGDATGVLE